MRKKIKVTFADKNLLKQAFIHRSYINENAKVGLEHNERLEFLGDAVLELVVTDFLFHKYPESNEGELTSYRAALVNTISISKAASELGMNDYLLLSKGEAKDTEKRVNIFLPTHLNPCSGLFILTKGILRQKNL